MDRSHTPQALECAPLLVPIMSMEKFAVESGLTEGMIQDMIEKGHLPSIRIGHYRMVNVTRLALDCLCDANLPGDLLRQ